MRRCCGLGMGGWVEDVPRCSSPSSSRARHMMEEVLPVPCIGRVGGWVGGWVDWEYRECGGQGEGVGGWVGGWVGRAYRRPGEHHVGHVPVLGHHFEAVNGLGVAHHLFG